MAGLAAPVRVVTDQLGVPHLYAENDLDLARAQGYVHARDRFFQMDATRREVSGDLAELLGPGALSGDIQNRTIGLRRAAERSYALLSDREKAILDAYAAGVNTWLDTNPLPPEYAAVELTHARRWNAIDTLAIGKGISASLSLDIDAGLVEKLDAYVTTGAKAQPPFDGRRLLFEDVERAAPIDGVSTVPDATGGFPFLTASAAKRERRFVADAAKAVRRFREKAASSKLLALAMDRRDSFVGSNEWGVGASASEAGVPMIANDPHLALDWPSTFYENHLVVSADPVAGPMNVSGVTFAGVPSVILGQNERITWGATTNPMDVTDLFRDRIVRGAPGCTATFCIESEGQLHPVDVQVGTYFVNQPGNGVLDDVVNANVPLDRSLILTVPFRSFGPIVDADDFSFFIGGVPETHVLVLQYTGFHGTGEVQTFLRWARARNLAEFREGLSHFDVGSQNWAYADADGNLAYFTSAELPLRRDLEDGAVAGLPPFFVRDGSGPNNWIPDPARSQGQAIPFAVLPEAEMPQTINPANGFFVNANNDPAGTSLDNDPMNQRRPGKPSAIYYLNGGYSDGLRAGRITRLVRAKLAGGGKISLSELREMQGNNQPLEAELLTPHVVAAFASAQRAGAPPELAALAADPRVAEAAARLAAWDYTTPTGIPEGYDAGHLHGQRMPFVSAREAAASVAATIENVWRAKLIKRSVDATLARVGVPAVSSTDSLKALLHLLARQPFTGVGASGVDFFPEPAALPPADRRDVAILTALRDALDALAGDDFATAFARSASQDDYRWGRLHRITFDHRLGGAFSLPPAAGFSDLAPGLPGLARDGGYEVVNASGVSARADRESSFRFGGGPVRRYAGAAGALRTDGARVMGFNTIAGGSSGVPGHPLAAAQLGDWLTADQHPVTMLPAEVEARTWSVERFEPAP